jgi:predicted enzyme related to lactoylglutathione lyase
MGQPVVHFEVIGKDGDKLRGYYSALFGWEFGDVVGPTNYAVVPREGNTNAEGVGIGGGVGPGPRGTTVTSPSTSKSPTSRPRWQRQRVSEGRG